MCQPGLQISQLPWAWLGLGELVPVSDEILLSVDDHTADLLNNHFRMLLGVEPHLEKESVDLPPPAAISSISHLIVML